MEGALRVTAVTWPSRSSLGRCPRVDLTISVLEFLAFLDLGRYSRSSLTSASYRDPPILSHTSQYHHAHPANHVYEDQSPLPLAAGSSGISPSSARHYPGKVQSRSEWDFLSLRSAFYPLPSTRYHARPDKKLTSHISRKSSCSLHSHSASRNPRIPSTCHRGRRSGLSPSR